MQSSDCIKDGHYRDDGISGTTFDRPGLNEMLALVDEGKVATIVVKDMSRIGRDCLQVGVLTEIHLPEKGVHFIAINDDVDSEKGGNELTPFRNIMNEIFSLSMDKQNRRHFDALAEE